MHLSPKSLSKLAEMICGGHGSAGGFHWKNFPYRSAPRLSDFFRDAGLPRRHPGAASRKFWVEEVLTAENVAAGSHPQLPSDAIVMILQNLFDARSFEETKLDRNAAIQDLNEVFKWDGLRLFADGAGVIQLESTGSAAKTVGLAYQLRRAWTEAEIKQKEAFANFLDRGSEDQITEQLLEPDRNFSNSFRNSCCRAPSSAFSAGFGGATSSTARSTGSGIRYHDARIAVTLFENHHTNPADRVSSACVRQKKDHENKNLPQLRR